MQRNTSTFVNSGKTEHREEINCKIKLPCKCGTVSCKNSDTLRPSLRNYWSETDSAKTYSTALNAYLWASRVPFALLPWMHFAQAGPWESGLHCTGCPQTKVLERFVPWSKCPMDEASHGRSVQWTMCPLDNAFFNKQMSLTRCIHVRSIPYCAFPDVFFIG